MQAGKLANGLRSRRADQCRSRDDETRCVRWAVVGPSTEKRTARRRRGVRPTTAFCRELSGGDVANVVERAAVVQCWLRTLRRRRARIQSASSFISGNAALRPAALDATPSHTPNRQPPTANLRVPALQSGFPLTPPPQHHRAPSAHILPRRREELGPPDSLLPSDTRDSRRRRDTPALNSEEPASAPGCCNTLATIRYHMQKYIDILIGP